MNFGWIRLLLTDVLYPFRLHVRKAAAYTSPPPELRLIPGILGGVLVPVGKYASTSGPQH